MRCVTARWQGADKGRGAASWQEGGSLRSLRALPGRSCALLPRASRMFERDACFAGMCAAGACAPVSPLAEAPDGTAAAKRPGAPCGGAAVSCAIPWPCRPCLSFSAACLPLSWALHVSCSGACEEQATAFVLSPSPPPVCVMVCARDVPARVYNTHTQREGPSISSAFTCRWRAETGETFLLSRGALAFPFPPVSTRGP